jgi:hypothetical protein
MSLASERNLAVRALTIGLIFLVLSCGGNPSPPVLSVGGIYPTQVTLQHTNTCGYVPVENNTTTVMHWPGAQTLSLTHAGFTYDGTIDEMHCCVGSREYLAHFSTTPKTISRGANQFTIAISGQFNRTGFDAWVRVDVAYSSPPATCGYTLIWVGTKSGLPNTIP